MRGVTCLYHTHICACSPAPNDTLMAKPVLNRRREGEGKCGASAGPHGIEEILAVSELELGELPALLLGEL